MIAAALAGAAAASPFFDRTIVAPAVPLLLFGVMVVVCLAIAIFPTLGSWGERRRFVASFVAFVWLALGIAALPVIVAVSCDCSGLPYVAFAPLGIAPRIWLALATFVGPALVLVPALDRGVTDNNLRRD